jgi:DNA/RNA-binding domain of Phe-tRNA-synthetase-like protein
MQVDINWSKDVSAKFPSFSVCVGIITDIRVERENEKTRRLKTTVQAEVREEHDIEKLKDNPTVRAYRVFYWRLGIDPTKTRPSGEALLRRVLHGDELPTISTVVDSYNLASMKTIVPISGFDSASLNPPLHVRFAVNRETFTGIGMSKPLILTDKILVLADKRQVLCVYPYRDSDSTKIGLQTREVVMIGYGAPGIADEQLKKAVETTLSFIEQVAGGNISTLRVFNSSHSG